MQILILYKTGFNFQKLLDEFQSLVHDVLIMKWRLLSPSQCKHVYMQRRLNVLVALLCAYTLDNMGYEFTGLHSANVSQMRGAREKLCNHLSGKELIQVRAKQDSHDKIRIH